MIKEKQAVSQQFKTVEVNNKQIPVLVGDLNENIKLVVITDNVLKKLVQLLPSVSPNQIIENLISNLGDIVRLDLPKDITFKTYIETLQNELEFHKSVNLINSYVKDGEPEITVQHETMKFKHEDVHGG